MNKWMVLTCALVLALGCSDDDGGGDGTAGDTGGDGSGASGTDGSGTGGTGSGVSGTSGGGSGSGTGGTGGAGGDATDGGTSLSPMLPGDTTEIPAELELCNGEVCECADGIDNDGDGEIDGFDVECSGPNDDREDSFWTGISGDNRDPFWQDCFFDGNSGAPRQTDCRYHTDCLTGAKDAADPDCEVTEGCLENCRPLTPNGCDCFGCCEVRVDGETVNVLISSDCNADNIDACDTCVQTESECRNDCGECELCPGKTVEDLPDTCFNEPPPPTGGTGGSGGTGGAGTGGTGGSGAGGTGGDPGGTPYTCEDMIPTCVDQSDCPSGRYCQQGCCILIGPT